MRTTKQCWNMSQSKYKAKKIHTEDGVFDSKKEYSRWLQLKSMEKMGVITNLERQVKFELIPVQRIAGKVVERACSYKADFTYKMEGEYVVEDAKGVRLPEYVIKRKLMLKNYGIRIQEV